MVKAKIKMRARAENACPNSAGGRAGQSTYVIRVTIVGNREWGNKEDCDSRFPLLTNIDRYDFASHVRQVIPNRKLWRVRRVTCIP